MGGREIRVDTALLRDLADQCHRSRTDLDIAGREIAAIHLDAAALGESPEARRFLEHWQYSHFDHDAGLAGLEELTEFDERALGRVAREFEVAEAEAVSGYAPVVDIAAEASSAIP
jgi:hypothetical protein